MNATGNLQVLENSGNLLTRREIFYFSRNIPRRYRLRLNVKAKPFFTFFLKAVDVWVTVQLHGVQSSLRIWHSLIYSKVSPCFRGQLGYSQGPVQFTRHSRRRSRVRLSNRLSALMSHAVDVSGRKPAASTNQGSLYPTQTLYTCVTGHTLCMYKQDPSSKWRPWLITADVGGFWKTILQVGYICWDSYADFGLMKAMHVATHSISVHQF